MNWDEKTPTCFRKRLFLHKEDAETWAKQKIPKPMRAYQCPLCQGWHLTSRVVPAKGIV